MWLRRDLRLADNPALAEAVARGEAVVPLVLWPDRGPVGAVRASPDAARGGRLAGAVRAPGGAARWWLARSLISLDSDLRRRGSALVIRRYAATPETAAAAVVACAREAGALRVVWVRGIDPPQRAEDDGARAALTAAGIEPIVVSGGTLLVEPDAVETAQGRPYQVFTPFWRTVSADLPPAPPLPAPEKLPSPRPLPAGIPLSELEREAVKPWSAGFDGAWQPGEAGACACLSRLLDAVLPDYADDRDRPDLEGSSRLSPHLHWGELSARQVWHAVAGRLAEVGLEAEAAIGPPSWREERQAGGGGVRAGSTVRGPSLGGAGSAALAGGAAAFLRQLGWREFAHHLLWHFPHTVDRPLREPFAAFPWREAPDDLTAWRRGRTGYPFVDAAMRCLWATGWMHNRARLVAGSFLVKDLLLPWQDGAVWFWDTLVDADLANNTLGWQWVAGCGADAAPYFRIFNPVAQGRRFDPDGAFVRAWVPELAGLPDAWIHEPWKAPADLLAAAGVRPGETYPTPVVDHGEARSRALAAYEVVKLAR